MSLTLTPTDVVSVFGNRRVRFLDVLFDNAYLAGGMSLKANDVGFGTKIELLLASPVGGLIFEYDYAASKLKAVYPTGGNVVSPSAIGDPAISAPTATLTNVVIPAGATPVTSSGAQPALTITHPTISSPNISPGRSKEVKAATDLSTITCRVMAIGY